MNTSVNDQQHYRIFLGELQQHYRDGDLTAKGALKFFFRLKLAEGWKCRINPRQLREFFSRQDEVKKDFKIMARSTFWKAINDLRDEGEIDFSEPSSIVIRLPRVPALPIKIEDLVESERSLESPQDDKRASVQNFEHRPEFCTPSKILDAPALDVNKIKPSSPSTDSSQISFKLCIEEPEKTQTENPAGKENSNPPDGQIPDPAGRGTQLENTPPPTRTPKYDSRLGIKPPSKIDYSVPPRPSARQRQDAGPWLDANTGEFNKEFVRHTVVLWKNSASFAKMTDASVAALVISHFLQKPELIPAKWQAFCEDSYRHAQSAAARMQAGINISEQEQKELVAKTTAIAYGSQLTAEDKLLPEPTPAPLPFTPTQPLPPATPASLPASPMPAPQEFTPEQMAANVARLAEITKQVGESRSMNFKRK